MALVQLHAKNIFKYCEAKNGNEYLTWTFFLSIEFLELFKIVNSIFICSEFIYDFCNVSHTTKFIPA